MQRHTLQHRATGQKLHTFEGCCAAVKGQHGTAGLGELIRHQKNRTMHAANHCFQLAANVGIALRTGFTVQPHDQQAGLVFQCQQGLGEVAVALALHHFTDARVAHPFFCLIQHMVPVFEGQLRPLAVKLRQILH